MLDLDEDVEFKKKQIGTLFFWVGAPEGGVRGGGCQWGVHNSGTARGVSKNLSETLNIAQ